MRGVIILAIVGCARAEVADPFEPSLVAASPTSPMPSSATDAAMIDAALPVIDALKPTAGIPLTGVTEIAAGASSSCAIASGKVYCFGDGSLGRLGDGTTMSRPFAREVPGLTGASAIAVGRQHACALVSGTIRCWGANYHGQLGRGTRTDFETSPAPVIGISDAVALSLGAHVSCAVRATGKIACFGNGSRGELGVPDEKAPALTPREIPSLPPARAVAAGEGFVCAITRDDALFCWGVPDLFPGPVDYSTVPRAPREVFNAVTAVSVGNFSWCAITGSALRCIRIEGAPWPAITERVVAVGSETACILGAPVRCTGRGDPAPDGASLRTVDDTNDAAGLAVGGQHACIRTGAGTMRCWGDNRFGQLGDGSTTRRLAPSTVTVRFE